jgi:post-segregation antitoxin (ccd killing protein)
MTDYTDKQALFDAINSASNSQLWAIASTISLQLKEASIERERAMSSDVSDITDADIRMRARTVLWNKLNDGTITAAEFGQFKDVFGLASAENDLNIRVISYRDICEGCPIGAEPEPIEPDHAA